MPLLFMAIYAPPYALRRIRLTFGTEASQYAYSSFAPRLMIPPCSIFDPGINPGTSISVKSGMPKQSQQRTKRAAFSPESISREPPSHIGFDATMPTTSESILQYPTTMLFPKSLWTSKNDPSSTNVSITLWMS